MTIERTDRLTDRTKRANLSARRYFGEFQWPTVLISITLAVAYVALHVGVIVGAVPLAVGVVALGPLGFASYICFHETAHSNLARRNGDRKLNDSIGIVLGQMLGAPLTAHRKEHLAHHAYTNRRGVDPDSDAFPTGRFGPTGIFTMLRCQYTHFIGNWGRNSIAERTMFVAEAAVILGWRLVFIAAFGWNAAILVVGGTIASLTVIAYLLVFLVHSRSTPLDEGRFIDTRTYTLDHHPRAVRLIVSWAWGFHNYHGVHHLYPKVPFYRMGRLFDEIRDLMEAQGAPIVPLWAPRSR